jgi:hypothetical protein
MRAAALKISSEFIRKSSPDLTTKNAWAQIARRKFYGQNIVKAAQAYFDLTEGQARGLVYASITQPTIDHILKRNPVEGFELSLEVAAIVTGLKLEEYLDHRAREAARAKAEWEAAERRLATLRACVPDGSGVARIGAGALGPVGTETSSLGAGAPGETLELHRDKRLRKTGG